VKFSAWPSPDRNWNDVLELARWAEDHGWYGVWMADHYMPNTGSQEVSDGPTNECWSYLAALAATTTDVRIGPLVSPTTVHHPALLASRAATIDNISGGRFVLGLGAGWQINEHRAYGIDLLDAKSRVTRFAEAIEIVHDMLRKPRTTFAGEHFRITDAPCEPKPIGEVPIVVGSKGPRMLGIIARFAQEWNCWGNPDATTASVRLLDAACEKVGRDPSTVQRSAQAMIVFADTPGDRAGVNPAFADRTIVGRPEEIAEQITAYGPQGFGEFIVPDFWDISDVGRKRELYERFATEVVPLVG
jgi:alkanesulfonate monooxygenase SsuD/methylene tetrahydromethanopterin reductase-like flavin-dependent oxidoreductase (luciferase family)